MARRSSDDIDIWFRTLPYVKTRCYAIALAVLNGLPTEYVAEAAEKLRVRLEPAAPSMLLGPDSVLPRLEPGDPFASSRQDRLWRLRARTRRDRFLSAVGWVPTEVVEYADDAYAAGVVERAWREYQIQDQLLDWLRDLGTHPADPVRANATAALGLLATHAFEQVRERVLEAWAASADEREREAAAFTLQVPADTPGLQIRAKRLTRKWYSDRTNPATQATAARSFGYSIGRADPEYALTNLDRLAMVDSWIVAVAVGHGLADLLAADIDRRAAGIFATLLRWLDDRERGPTGELAFLTLASYLDVEPDPAADRPRVDEWPALLELADRHPRLRGALAHLWRRVLHGIRASLADKVLRGWAGYAEYDDRLCVVLGQFARAVAEGHERSRQHLLRQAAEWVGPTELRPLPKAAAAVRSALTPRKETP
jgi:hypothetical protein